MLLRPGVVRSCGNSGAVSAASRVFLTMAGEANNHKDLPKPDTNGFRIVREELSYSRYLDVYNRVVEYPPDDQNVRKVVEYDIAGSRNVSFLYCAVLPFDTKTKLVTLIKEYAQGCNDLMYSVPCGGLSKSHASLEDCAMKELSEEAHLRNGKLIKLLQDDHPGLLEVKWCRNRFTPYLVLDPEVDLPKLKEIMYSGQMMLPSIVTCGMALNYLQEHNLLDD